MAKNDFDIDFDFEKEYGFDPKAILDSDMNDEDLDLTQFEDEQLSMDLSSGEAPEVDFTDFDLDALDLEEPAPQEEAPEEPVFEAEYEDEDLDLDFDDEEDEEEFQEEPLMDFSRRASFFEENAQEEPAEALSEEDDMPLASVYDDPEDAEYDEDDPDDEDEDDPDEDGDPLAKKRERRAAKKREPIKFTMPELTVPPFLMKLYKLYFPSIEEIDPKPDPNAPRRRRKSKLQVFKEAYLPAILAGVSLLLVVCFLFGSLGNAITRKQQADAAAKLEAQAAASQQAQAAQQAQQALEEAARLAAGYDYEGAISLLESLEGSVTDSTELTAKKAEYAAAQSKLVEHKDLSTVPNLSFHVLIHDLSRALADTDSLAGQYNRNFVTTEEFSKILDQLYKNNYVLVDMDSFVGSNTGVDGTPTFFPQTVYLPEGKKPVMITETMVNYFAYMIDGDDNGVPDAGGDGFASRLVIDNNGDIKAEYVDANGQTQVGNYDLVPILESFIEAHPDFCYRGARATLAVCGHEGVFGYRVNNTYVPTMGQTYVDEQIALAKDLVASLRAKGYTIACYTYGNLAYGEKNVNQIQADMQQWTSQITPILGEVDTLVFARTSDIGDYSGPKFEMLTSCGIRYFIKHGEDPYAEVNNTFVRQTRLMVTGNTMAWKASMFTDDGLFDPITVLDPARGNVPN